MPPTGAIVLGDIARYLTTIEIRCYRCSHCGRANVARLMQQYGPDMQVPTLLRVLSADCRRHLAKRRAAPCEMYLPELPPSFSRPRV